MSHLLQDCVRKALNLIETACKRKNIRLQIQPTRGELVEPSPVLSVVARRAETEGRRAEFPKIVMGLSGGPDSVFLLHVLHELQKQNKIELVATHLDHQWRVESFKDVEFCHALCESLGIEFIAYKADQLNLNIKFNGSKEELGRKMRRVLFQRVLTEKKADFIALAHHMNDKQETFFLRLLRGASLSGLCCMNEIDGQYIRPLLDISKREILEYLDSNQIKYLIDPTNASPDYLRNRIRLNVIPALEQCDSRFNQKLQDTLKQLRLEDDFLKSLAAQAFIQIFEQKTKKLNSQVSNKRARPELVEGCERNAATNNWQGALDKFRALDPVLARRVILHWLIQEKLSFSLSSSYLDEIIKFLNAPHGGDHQVGNSWKIIKKQKLFWIEVY